MLALALAVSFFALESPAAEPRLLDSALASPVVDDSAHAEDSNATLAWRAGGTILGALIGVSVGAQLGGAGAAGVGDPKVQLLTVLGGLGAGALAGGWAGWQLGNEAADGNGLAQVCVGCGCANYAIGGLGLALILAASIAGGH